MYVNFTKARIAGGGVGSVGLSRPISPWYLRGVAIAYGPGDGKRFRRRRLRLPDGGLFAGAAETGRGVAGTDWTSFAGALTFVLATALGPGDPSAVGPGLAAPPCCVEGAGKRVGPGLGTPGVGFRICTWDDKPGVTTACGVAWAISGANVATGALGCAIFGTGRAVGAAVGACVGGAVAGTRTVAATTLAGTVVGTAATTGIGVRLISGCVGCGFGAAEASGAGVGFGGAVGANLASSWRIRGWGCADLGCATACCGATRA